MDFAFDWMTLLCVAASFAPSFEDIEDFDEWPPARPPKPFRLRTFLRPWIHWLQYWVTYFFICYVLIILLYNFLKARPYRWPFLLVRWLLGKIRLLGRRFYHRFWRRIPFFSLRFFVGFSFWWDSFFTSLEGSLSELGNFYRCFKFRETFKPRAVFPALRDTLKQGFRVLRSLSVHHIKYVYRSALGFLYRPLMRRWTVFGFFKHLFGWGLGISFFYYLFLWVAYFFYFLCDCFFSLLDVFCGHFLKPVFFSDGDDWQLFLGVYERALAPARVFVLVVLFDLVPYRVGVIKDRFTSRDFWVHYVLRRILIFLNRQLIKFISWLYVFITYRAYYQTRRFLRFFFKALRWLRRFGRRLRRRSVGYFFAVFKLYYLLGAQLRRIGYNLWELRRWVGLLWRLELWRPLWLRVAYLLRRRFWRLVYIVRLVFVYIRAFAWPTLVLGVILLWFLLWLLIFGSTIWALGVSAVALL